MRTTQIPFALLLLTFGLCQTHADTIETIDFETIPGAMPSEGLAISDQYEESLGVTFSLEGGGAPVLAEVGAPRTAFIGYNGIGDNPAPNTNVGAFFLTDDGVVSGTATPIVIDFDSPMFTVSGVFLDIDFNEQWLVEARDANEIVLESLTLPPNNNLDGSATDWEFNRSTADIHSVRFEFTGTPSGVGVGLALDNVSFSSIPEPSSLLILASILSLVAQRRRRKM